MKLITLNAWGGKLHAPLLEFFKKQSGSVDVFCLQEIFSSETETTFSSSAKMNLLQDLGAALPGYRCFFARKSHGYDYTGYIGKLVDFGNAIFIKDAIPVLGHQEMFEAVVHPDHDWRKTAVGQAQLLTIEHAGQPLAICNFHGVWINGTNKRDVPERLEQSRQVRAALDGLAHEKILCGDFNLIPDGESIRILEQGMCNLISEYGITSTRSSLYDKEFKFADYILVSPGLEVLKFGVMPEEVSDHLALELDFELKPAAASKSKPQEQEIYGARN